MAGLNEVGSKVGLTSNEVKAVFTAVLDLCKAGEDVSIQGIGKFSKKHKEARTGRNPATGDSLEIAAKDVFHFKASSVIDMTPPKAAAGGRRR
jgi:DNA-binding protein HU-beta